MGLEVYKEKKHAPVYLNLHEHEDGRIRLVIVDATNKVISNGTILSIDEGGIFLHPRVNTGIGLATVLIGGCIVIKDKL